MQHVTKRTLAALDSRVPVLHGRQAQGDLMVLPWSADTHIDLAEIPPDGTQLIQGATSGNSHWLLRGPQSHGVRWAVGPSDRDIAFLFVPQDQCAWLVHTEEHYALGIGAGLYLIRRKRQQALFQDSEFDTEVLRRTEWVED